MKVVSPVVWSRSLSSSQMEALKTDLVKCLLSLLLAAMVAHCISLRRKKHRKYNKQFAFFEKDETPTTAREETPAISMDKSTSKSPPSIPSSPARSVATSETSSSAASPSTSSPPTLTADTQDFTISTTGTNTSTRSANTKSTLCRPILFPTSPTSSQNNKHMALRLVEAKERERMAQELCQSQQQQLHQAQLKISKLETQVRDYQLKLLNVQKQLEEERQKSAPEPTTPPPPKPQPQPPQLPPRVSPPPEVNRQPIQPAYLEELAAEQWIDEKEQLSHKIETLQHKLKDTTTKLEWAQSPQRVQSHFATQVQALQREYQQSQQTTQLLQDKLQNQQETIQTLQQCRKEDKVMMAELQQELHVKLQELAQLQVTYQLTCEDLTEVAMDNKMHLEKLHEVEDNLIQEQEMHQETILKYKDYIQHAMKEELSATEHVANPPKYSPKITTPSTVYLDHEESVSVATSTMAATAAAVIDNNNQVLKEWVGSLSWDDYDDDDSKNKATLKTSNMTVAGSHGNIFKSKPNANANDNPVVNTTQSNRELTDWCGTSWDDDDKTALAGFRNLSSTRSVSSVSTRTSLITSGSALAEF